MCVCVSGGATWLDSSLCSNVAGRGQTEVVHRKLRCLSDGGVSGLLSLLFRLCLAARVGVRRMTAAAE